MKGLERHVYETLKTDFKVRDNMKKVVSKKELDSELKANKNVLALFYSTWCPYCMRFFPAFKDQASKKGFENIIHVILDDDDDPLWDEYGIAAVPTVIYFEDGKVSKRLDAQLGLGLSEFKLQEWLKQFK